MSEIANLLEKIVVSSNDDEIVLRANKVKSDNFSYGSLKKLGDFLLTKKYYEYAEIIYDHILGISEPSSDTLYNKSLALFNLGRYEESIFTLDQVITLNKDYVPEAYTKKAIALEFLNRAGEAKYCYEQAKQKYTERIKMLTENAESLQKLGHYDISLKDIDQILTLEPNNIHGLYLKGLALFKLGRFEESFPVFEKHIKYSPNNVEALSYYGKASLSLENYDKAITLFDRVINITNNQGVNEPDAFYFKGNAFLSLGQVKKAEDSFKEALRLYEKTVGTEKERILPLETLRSIHSNYDDNLDFKEAVSCSKQLITLDKNKDIKFQLMLAEDLIKSNDLDEGKNPLKTIQDISQRGKYYKDIYQFLTLCSSFLDTDDSNDHTGVTNFLNEFFSGRDTGSAVVGPKAWNFNGIKYVIGASPVSEQKRKLLFEIINYIQTKETKEILLDSINSYLSSETIALDKRVSETRRKNKMLVIGVLSLVGVTAAFGLPAIYYTVVHYHEYPLITVPKDIVDWTIDSNDSRLYYVTQAGKFGEYYIGPYKHNFIWAKLQQFFTNKDPFITETNIGTNPGNRQLKIIHDDKSDITYVIDQLLNDIKMVHGGKVKTINFQGSPTDLKFD